MLLLFLSYYPFIFRCINTHKHTLNRLVKDDINLIIKYLMSSTKSKQEQYQYNKPILLDIHRIRNSMN